MSNWHTIQVKAGDLSWTIRPGDPGAPGTLHDGLKITTNWRTDHPVQGAPDPATARFGIVVDDIGDVATLSIGDKASILVWRSAPQSYDLDATNPAYAVVRLPLIQFIGRISDMDAATVDKGRTVVWLTLTDRLADLAEITVGGKAWAQETMASRVERIFTEAAQPIPYDFLYGTIGAKEDVPAQSALAALQDTLAQAYEPPASVPTVRFVTPEPHTTISTDAPIRAVVGDDLTPYVPDDITMRPWVIGTSYKPALVGNATDGPLNLPGLLAVLPSGKVGVVIEPVPYVPGVSLTGGEDLVIPADMVELGVNWRKSRPDRIDRVTVTTGDGVVHVRELPGSVPVEHRAETDLLGTQAPGWLADLLLPDTQEDAWSLDRIVIRDLPEQVRPYWFVAMAQRSGTRQTVVVDGIQPRQNPNGGTFWAGMVTNAELTFDKGRWSIEAEVSAAIPRPLVMDAATAATLGEAYLSPGNLRAAPAPLNATRPRDLDPTLTPIDLRIVRRPE